MEPKKFPAKQEMFCHSANHRESNKAKRFSHSHSPHGLVDHSFWPLLSDILKQRFKSEYVGEKRVIITAEMYVCNCVLKSISNDVQ